MVGCILSDVCRLNPCFRRSEILLIRFCRHLLDTRPEAILSLRRGWPDHIPNLDRDSSSRWGQIPKDIWPAISSTSAFP